MAYAEKLSAKEAAGKLVVKKRKERSNKGKMRANGHKNDDRGKGRKPGVTCSRNDEDGGHEGSGNEEQQQPPRKKRKCATVCNCIEGCKATPACS